MKMRIVKCKKTRTYAAWCNSSRRIHYGRMKNVASFPSWSILLASLTYRKWRVPTVLLSRKVKNNIVQYCVAREISSTWNLREKTFFFFIKLSMRSVTRQAFYVPRFQCCTPKSNIPQRDVRKIKGASARLDLPLRYAILLRRIIERSATLNFWKLPFSQHRSLDDEEFQNRAIAAIRPSYTYTHVFTPV